MSKKRAALLAAQFRSDFGAVLGGDVVGAFAVCCEIKAVDFGFLIHAQRGDQADEFHQYIGHNNGEDADDGQRAELSCPSALAKHCNHDGAEDASYAVHSKHIQCVVDFALLRTKFTAS